MATSSDSGPGQSTPEYLTLLKHYPQVKDHVKEQPETICDALFSKGYLTHDTRDQIRYTKANYKAAGIITDTLIDRIQYKPKVFHDFMEILRNQGPFTEDIVQCLDKSYSEESKMSAQQASACVVVDRSTAQQTNSCLVTDIAQCLRFVCPSCAQCTPIQYFSLNGCQVRRHHVKVPSRSLFPFLDCSRLTEDERFLFEGRLVQDTKEIFVSFELMVDTLISSLKSKRVDVSQLRHFVFSEVKQHGNEEDIKRLRNADSIADVFIALISFRSFFHYEIIERIVRRFGRRSDKEEMKKYIDKFKKYCQRNVFEVPSNVLCNREPEAGSKCFVFKHSKNESKSLQDIGTLRWKLADLLNINVLSLQLCSVTTGCVCLNFLATEQEAEEITTNIAVVKEAAFEELDIKFLGVSDIPEHSDRSLKKKSLVSKAESQTAMEKVSLVQDTNTSAEIQLCQLILSNGAAAKDELKRFNFQKNLESLITQLFESKDLKLVHIETLIKHSESVNPKKFKNAIKQISLNSSEKLIRFCQQKEELLEKILLLLSYNEEQILELIKDDGSEEEFCCKLFETKYLQRFSRPNFIIQKLSKSGRTQYLLKTMQAAKSEEALLVLDSGEILPDKIDLGTLTKKILLSKDLLSKLLESGVNACGLTSTTPLTILVTHYPRDTHKKNLQARCQTVECMEALINAGANVEDLNSYHSGLQTSPIHVATDIVLTTGKIEFLKLVWDKWTHDFSQDSNGQTALHIAAKGCKSPTFNDIWMYFTNECKVDKSIEDVMGKNAAFYLSLGKQKELGEASEELPVKRKKKQSSQPPTRTPSPTPKLPPLDSKPCSDDESDRKVTVFGQLTSDSDPSETLSNTLESDTEESSTTSKQEGTEEHLREMITELLKKPNSYFEDTKKASSLPASKQTESEDLQQPSRKKVSHSEMLSLAEAIAERKWEVELLEHVEKELRKMDSKPVLKNFFRIIKELANCGWRDKLRIKVKKTKSCVIYKAEITADTYLLYTFLDRFSERKTLQARECIRKQVYVYTKTIVVLDILQHGKETHYAERVIKIISNDKFRQNLSSPDEAGQCSPQISIRCEQKLSDSDQNELAVLFTNLSTNEERHDSDIGTRAYSLDTQLVLGLITGTHKQRDYPIKVADDEFDIINKGEDGPIVVLGRSGTGKTTVCLCRMWRKFTAYWDCTERAASPLIPKSEHKKVSIERSASDVCQKESTEFEHIHQIFVTKSSKLCDQMKKRFRDFIADYEPAEKQRELLDQIDSLPDPKTFSEVNEMCYPLFLTAQQFFSMLDKSLDDDKEYIEEETTFYSEEQPKHSELKPLKAEIEKQATAKTDKKLQGTEVTASLFQKKIWPKIKKNCLSDKKIDPLLVWMEIQSYIKGSLRAVESPKGVLIKKNYEDFGRNQAPNFPMKREEVYDLFIAYEDLIKHQDIKTPFFDNGDFIYKLYNRIKNLKKEQSWSIHEVYIDEVQDFTQAELSVIIRCCKNPNSCFFSGDTAQTIIKGIAFRFEDLESIFYSIAGVKKIKRNILTLNHRSHNGIAKFASTITDLMRHFFPKSFDWQNIPSDNSNIIGPRPLFAYSEESIKSFIDLQSEGDIRFGANQVVIVRDDEALVTIPESLKQCIVLTITQCKGLEFNDVLLYNFFSDWEDRDKKVTIWNASTTYLLNNPEKAINQPCIGGIRPLVFDEMQHKSLCAELKYLYTVATRAKYHLWIFEHLSPESLPMLDYWYRRDVVQMKESSEIAKELRLLSTPSSEEDWRKRGDELYKKEIWSEAEKCYIRAKEPYLAKQAYIKRIEEEAEEVPSTKTSLYKAKIRLAAAGHISCSERQHKTTHLLALAKNLQQLEMYKESATLFEKLQKIECALEIYQFYLKDVDKTVQLMEKLNRFQEVVDYACKQVQRLALKLIIRYKKEGNLSQEYIEATADREIKKFTKLNELSKAKPWLQFISNINNYIAAIKTENKIVAFRLLKILEKFEEAFSFARAQAMTSEGKKLAEDIDRPDMVTTFQLQQATQEISSSQKIEAKDLLSDIKTIATTHKDFYITARALVLLARHKGDEENGREVRIKYCEQAQDIYKNKLMNQFGEIECYNVLRGLKNQALLKIRVEETIAAVKLANRLIQDLTSKPMPQVNELKIFLGFETNEKGEIYIPKNQDQWRIGYERGQQIIMDGMVKVSSSNLCVLVQSHLAKRTNTWLDDIMSFLDSNFHSCGFACHNDIKKKQLKISKLEKYNMERYAVLFELENKIVDLANQQYKIHHVCTKRLIHKPIDTLIILLSPYSQIHLQFTEKEYTAIQSSSLKPVLTQRLKSDSESDSFDAVLNAWQINTALNLLDETHFHEITGTREYGHFTSVWIKSNQLLRRGENILYTIEESVKCLEQSVGLNKCNSLENLIATFTVYTTALLVMLSYSMAWKNIFIPETFSKFVNHFDSIHFKQPGINLYKACLDTAKKLKVEEVNEKALALLNEILMLILGIKFGQFEAPDDYSHALTLAVTLFGNLLLMYTDETKLRGVHQKILLSYKNPPRRFSEAYTGLEKAEHARHLFKNVIQIFLERMEMKVMQLSIVRPEAQKAGSIKFLACKFDDISTTDIPKDDPSINSCGSYY